MCMCYYLSKRRRLYVHICLYMHVLRSEGLCPSKIHAETLTPKGDGILY